MHRTSNAAARGYSLLEMMIVLVVLTLGILAIAKLFPTAGREQVKDRLRTSGSYYAEEKVETLRALNSTDPALTDGRHPDASTNETVDANGTFQRYWSVSHLPDPLGNLARLDVTVTWHATSGPDSCTTTTYVNH